MKIITDTQQELENCGNLINNYLLDFESYYNFLIEYNQKVNLTAITQKEEVFVKHFLDSVLAQAEIPVGATVVDVGTGAGFPSLPLKLVREDISLCMVDSLNKRITFLNQLCKLLNVEADKVHARAEDFALKNKEVFDVAVARAVAKTNTLVEYLLPLIKVGGKVILYKSGNYEEELKDAEHAIEILGGQINSIKLYNLPKDMGERSLIIIDKIKKTPKTYPRGKNLPKLQPL